VKTISDLRTGLQRGIFPKDGDDKQLEAGFSQTIGQDFQSRVSHLDQAAADAAAPLLPTQAAWPTVDVPVIVRVDAVA
jgi:hypothetical protein